MLTPRAPLAAPCPPEPPCVSTRRLSPFAFPSLLLASSSTVASASLFQRAFLQVECIATLGTHAYAAPPGTPKLLAMLTCALLTTDDRGAPRGWFFYDLRVSLSFYRNWITCSLHATTIDCQDAPVEH